MLSFTQLLIFTIATIVLFLVQLAFILADLTTNLLDYPILHEINDVLWLCFDYYEFESLDVLIFREVLYCIIAMTLPIHKISFWSIVRYFIVINLMAFTSDWISNKIEQIYIIIRFTYNDLYLKYHNRFRWSPKLQMIPRLEPVIKIKKINSAEIFITPQSPSNPTFAECSDIFITYAISSTYLLVELCRCNLVINESKLIYHREYGFENPENMQMMLKASMVKENNVYFLTQTFNELDESVTLKLHKEKLFPGGLSSVYDLRRLSARWNSRSSYTMAIYESDLFILMNPDNNVRGDYGVKLILLNYSKIDILWKSPKNAEERIIYCLYYIDIESAQHCGYKLYFNVFDGFVTIDLMKGTLQHICYNDSNRRLNVYPEFFILLNEVNSQFVQVYRLRYTPDSLLFLSVKFIYRNYGWHLKSLCKKCLLEFGVPICIAEECRLSMLKFRVNMFQNKLIMYSSFLCIIVMFWIFWYLDDLRV